MVHLMRQLPLTAAALVIASSMPLGAQEKDELQKCDKPFRTIAVNEPQQEYMTIFARYKLGSPAAQLRIMAQNSKCFLVVERGIAMQNIQQERALARSEGGSHLRRRRRSHAKD